MPRLPKLRDRPEPRIDTRLSMFDLGCVITPGTQPRTSLIVFAGPFLNAVSGTKATPPGMRSMMARACAMPGTVRLPPGGVSRPVAVGALVFTCGVGAVRRAA